MSSIKMALVYYSSTGTNYLMAKEAAEGAQSVGAETRVLRVPELAPEEAIASNPEWKAHYEETKDVVPVATPEDLAWADAIIFSTPTRFGNMASQLKQFLDQTGGLWFEGKLTNKVVSAMTSAGNVHGGQEITLLSLYTTFYHWGAIIVPPGYTDDSIYAAGGNPYGTSATVKPNEEIPQAVFEAARHQAKRVVEVAKWIKQGQGEGTK